MKKVSKKIILNFLILLIFTFSALLIFGYIRIRVSFPVRNGKIELKGIKDKVFIYFNEYGIPFIEAKYLEDAIFAEGYLHAQERMFQMDLLRRAATGELSEIFGEKTFKVDSFFRVLGIKRIAMILKDSLLPIEKKILESYARGVNAYIEKRKGQLPIEFLILNYKPEKWKIEHSLAIGRLISWNLNLSFKGDLLFTKIKNRIDTNKIKDYLPFYPPDAPSQIEEIPKIEEKHFKLLKKIEKFIPQFYASNSFASSYPPLLENDPHLDLTIPANWYLLSINTDSLKGVGFSIPGTPLLISGTNWDIAIGVTSLQLDDGDFIISDLNNLKIIEEKIKIKGKGERKIKIFIKDNMPLVDKKNKLFYFWRSNLISHEIYALYKLYNSKNVYQADTALRYFRSPALNFIIVDKEGNLLYKACGWIEKRKSFSIFPRKEVPSEFLPDSLLPKVINPYSGYLVSCNNPPLKAYPYYISLFFSPSGRARRLNELLKNSKNITLKNFMNFSIDIKDEYAKIITDYILKIIKNIPMEEKERKIYEKLKNFDFYIRKERGEPLIFYRLIYKIFENYYKKKNLGEEIYKEFLSFAYIPLSVLENNLREGKIDEYVVIKSFREVCEEYEGQKYGKYHKVKLFHPLSIIPVIGRFFKLKEIEIDGSLTTINKMGFKLENPFYVTEGPSMRMIVDLENKNFYYILPPGQSGVLFDKNYSDQYYLWISGRYLSLFPFKVKNKLILKPSE